MATIPKISIITPSYNQARFLEECIRSVLNQGYPNLEYIIIDGGSKDGSVDVIKKYADRLAYWISEPDGGQSAAINKGLRLATGQIWAWMNSDDLYLPGAVSKAVDWLANHPEYDIVYGDCLWVDENGQEGRYFNAKSFNFHDMLANGFKIPSGSTFIRRAASDKIGNFDEALHYIMDSEYWLRAAQICAFGYLPEVLSLYRVYPTAKTWDVMQSENRAYEIVGVRERFWSQANLPESIRPLRRWSLANTYLYVAELALQAGNRNLCVHYTRKGLAFGLAALQPRLMRVLVHLWFGESVASALRKLWYSARQE